MRRGNDPCGEVGEKLGPNILLFFPVSFVRNLSEFVFWNFGEEFALAKQDLLLDGRREKRHGHELVDSSVAHV